MSRSKATKRRKVWANWYPAVGAAPAHWGTRLGTKADACMAAQPCAEQVCLTERLPGDVVLSREQSAALKTLAEWEGNSEEPVAWEYGLKPNPNCHKCGGKGVYTWQDGHNGDDHESDCDCTRAVALTVGQALAPFRGRR